MFGRGERLTAQEKERRKTDKAIGNLIASHKFILASSDVTSPSVPAEIYEPGSDIEKRFKEAWDEDFGRKLTPEQIKTGQADLEPSDDPEFLRLMGEL